MALSIDDPVPGQAVFPAHRMEDAHNLAGGTRAAGESSNLAVSHYFSFRNIFNDTNHIFGKRSHVGILSLSHIFILFEIEEIDKFLGK